jgi:hypothetical protein
MASDEKKNGLKSVVKDVIDQILPPSEVKLDTIKEEIWTDLSALYYKYEDEEQKKAFREVMQEICDKLSQGKWDTVYRKLYKEEKKDKAF